MSDALTARAVVFDFAGVVFHWDPPAMLMRELPHLASDAAAAREWLARIYEGFGGTWARFDRGTIEADELVAHIAARAGIAHADAHTAVHCIPRELRPHPAAVAVIETLHAAGVPIFFLSNMPAPYAARLEAEHPVVGRFRDGIFSARVNLIKPERAIYELAAERFGFAPAELLFLDDHAANVHAARDAGWQALHVIDPQGIADQLAGAGLATTGRT